MKELLGIVNEIIKYGLDEQIQIDDKESDLEKNLIHLYAQYTQSIDYNQIDLNADVISQDYSRNKLNPDVLDNVKRNFKNFGYYHIPLNPLEVQEKPDMAIGDAIDDLADIIYDLLEFKWKLENQNEKEALWFFNFSFKYHSKNHLIDLLTYLFHLNH